MVEQGLGLASYSLQEMPYDSVQALPAAVKKLSPKRQRQWMDVWNSTYKACMAKDEGGAASCEAEAFRNANGVTKGAEMPEASPSKFDMPIKLEKSDAKANYHAAADGQGWQCGDCRFFDPAWRSCSLVEGTIEPSYTCSLWTAKLPSQDGSRLYSEQAVQIFVEAPQIFKADLTKPTWIPFLPTPGVFKHPLYGEIDITQARNHEFVDSVKNKVYQDHIPLDAEHETKLSGAVAWIKDMRMNDDGSADAYVEWTDRGRTLAGGDNPQFKYISPEWFDQWTDPATGDVHNNVVAGGAITTRPFFKDKVLRALVASERGAEVLAAETNMTKKCAECGKMYSDNMANCPSCGSSKVATEGGNNVPDGNAVKFDEAQQKELDRLLAEAKTGLFTEDQVKARETAAAEAAKKAAEPPVDSKEFKDSKEFTELQTQLTEAKTANETLQKSLKAITDAERHRRFTDLVSGNGGENDGGPWVGDKAAQVAFLESLADKVGESDKMFTDYVTQQNAAAAQLREASLFKQTGSSAVGASGAQGKLDQLARALMEKDPKLSFSAAEAQALGTEEGARLYSEINAVHPGTPRA